jgi:hypothetical protein
MPNLRERFLRTKVGRPSGVQSPQIASNKRRWNTSKSKKGRTKRKPIQFRLGKGFLFLFYFLFYFILLGAVEARTSQHCGRTSKLYVVQSKKENTDLKWGKKDLANFVFGLWNIFHSDTMKHRRELYLSFNSLYIVVPHFH